MAFELDPTGTPPVQQLLQTQAQLQEWLDRLDQQSAVVSERVVARVRADYQQRLQHVLEELRSHVEGLQSEHAAAREAVAEAERELSDAADQLDEARLRNAIGELNGAEWETRRARLEEAVADATERRDSLRVEMERLDEILAQVHFPAPAEEPPAPRASEEEPEPWAGPDDEETMEAPPAPAPRAASLGDGLAFLQELDRAMADGEEEVSEDAAPRPRAGTKCAECGYTNDADAWYCGVCGIDLA